jgi:hypothetical protein
LPGAEYVMKKKRTRREKFVAETECIVRWARLIAVIEPLYQERQRQKQQGPGIAAKPLFRSGGASGIRTPDLRIMIPSL